MHVNTCIYAHPYLQMALSMGAVDSVMVDGSALPYEDNVKWTAKMTQAAHAKVGRKQASKSVWST